MAVPVARSAKLAAKYGPYVVAAAKAGGPAARQVVQTQQQRLANRAKAFDKAGTVQEGSVLRLRHGDEVVWVVFTRDEPVEVYPAVEAPMGQVVANADLSRRVTPAEREEARLRRRARRAAGRARRKVRRRKA